MTIKQYITGFLALFFPRLCLACGKTLFEHEEYICNPCWLALPRTHFHLDPENPVCQTFWGRVWLIDVAACFYYARGNRVQRIIHQLKYKGEEELGVYLGQQYGTELRNSGFLANTDVIIPVPLHPKKLKKRGYNQSEVLAKGIGQSMGVEVINNQLFRTKYTETQTKRSRFSRWKNVENLFELRDPLQLKDKHVIVVDDVITTGATIEACVEALQKVPGIKVSVLAMAYSNR